ncbi:fatty acid desaturase family protein [Burkholderia aenigmatica]|uniref:fatty acid desaturase family protein n=1 Tax=Burkholderia aenigmatica TaxID=2015348 RepID=UPI003B42DE5B
MFVANACAIDNRSRHFDRLNLCVLALQSVAWVGILTWLSHGTSPFRWLSLVPFCLIMQGVFSMMHETFHGFGHRSRVVNYLMMGWASTMFGAAATLIHVNHLGHHIRNRTLAERVDFVEPDASLWRKRIEYYAAIVGGIWFASFVGSLVLAVLPSRIPHGWAKYGHDNTYAAAFRDFDQAEFRRIRYETLAGVAAWTALGALLDWRMLDIALAYLAFAFSWSSLQWVYHMHTPLDVVEGTYNMRAPTLIRWAFLNFNYNLTHHRHPSLRWQELHTCSDAAETRPLWYGWLHVFEAPRRLPSDLTQLDKTYF